MRLDIKINNSLNNILKTHTYFNYNMFLSINPILHDIQFHKLFGIVRVFSVLK